MHALSLVKGFIMGFTSPGIPLGEGKSKTEVTYTALNGLHTSGTLVRLECSQIHPALCETSIPVPLV